MAGLPNIPTLNPVTIPARAEQTYDRWYVVSLFVDGKDPNRTTAHAKLRKCGTDPQGDTVFHPDEPEHTVVIDNVFQAASTDPQLANAMGLIILVVSKLVATDELTVAVSPHTTQAEGSASRAAAAKNNAESALVTAQAAAASRDSAALETAKYLAAEASTSAQYEAKESAIYAEAAVAAANGSTLPGIVALVVRANDAKNAAAMSAKDAATASSTAQALTI